MEQLEPESIIKRTNDQVSKKLNEVTIVMSIEEGKYFNLNRVASRIWEIIEQPKTIRQVVEQLLLEFEIAHDDCEREVKELIADLADLGLIHFG